MEKFKNIFSVCASAAWNNKPDFSRQETKTDRTKGLAQAGPHFSAIIICHTVHKG